MQQDLDPPEYELTESDEASLTTRLPWDDGRRTYPRWYFHDPEVPFEEQTSGIAGQVRRPGVFYDSLIGRIIVKDMSVGGIGFIAPRRYNLPKRVVVNVGNGYPLLCEILHCRPVNRALNFYGARWYRMDRQVVMLAIARYGRMCRLVS